MEEGEGIDMEHIGEKVALLGQILFKRFILGWYGVEKKIDVLGEDLKEIKGEIEELLERVCEDCPTKRRV